MFQRLLVVAVALTSISASASFQGPLLIKFNGAGHVPQELITYTRCEVYADRLVLTQGIAGVQSVQERKLTLDGNLAAIIEAASKGPITSETAPTDGPSSVYSANRVLPNDSVESVDLGQYTSGKRTRNKAMASQSLRNLLDMICN